MTGAAAPSNRFSLRTFGTLTLVGDDENTVLGQHGHHRRRLALMAVLAAAGDRGWSRDQLLLFFWPEATQARARHSLEQLLYALRSSMSELLFATTNPVALNPDVIRTDVGDFNAAVEEGDFEAAVRYYQGPFLDGFYVDDAPEFERWVEEERARLRARYTTALERLATAADAANDRTAAVRWWRALVEAEPLSARSALGYMTALRWVGDHAAVLQFAEQYESTVARELGTSAGPAVASLVAEVRTSAGTDRIQRARPIAVPPPETSVISTPGGRVPATGPATAIRPGFSRRALGMTAVLVTVIAVLFAATRNGRTTDPLPRSIAVLPFINVSRDSADAVLVDALSEELNTALTRITDLRVTARQSSFAFRGSTLPAQRIGDSLHVTHLLEGSIQRNGATLRVQVRLVDATTGVTIWSARYDPELRDIFAMQSEVAASVARELNLQLGAAVVRRMRRGLTQNIAAYELYLRGRDPVHLRTASGPMDGLRQLRDAVTLDSTFAAAYAAMPYMYFAEMAHARDAAHARELEQAAESVARKALALDAELPEAHVGLAVALAMDYRRLAESEAALRRALALGGAPRVRESLGRVLMWSGRHAEALEQAVRAAAEDPLSASAIADVGEALCVNRRYREGLAALHQVSSVQPPLKRVAGYQGVCYLMQGLWPEAIAVLSRDSSDAPWSVLLGYAVARSGDTARARDMERLAIERWQRTGRGAIRVAYIAEGLGERDKALAWLARTGNDRLTSSAVMYPLFDDLHADPRFEAFRQRIGASKRR